MALVLEVEFLSGVSFSAPGPDADAPDWPPQPDRMFSALVATWAARGKNSAEAAALQWLEQLSAPEIHASMYSARSAAIAFVPPNDPSVQRAKAAVGVHPAHRRRQPRRFPAAVPAHPRIRFVWHEAQPDDYVIDYLQALAADTAYLGHSASLTRCRFWIETTLGDPDFMQPPLRWVYRGRFSELCHAFEAGLRPSPGNPVGTTAIASEDTANVFDSRWLILEHVSGTMPDLRACGIVARTIREALLSGYRQSGNAKAVPELVSGHSPNGRPTSQPHLAIVPLPFVGFRHADGHVLGFALVPPQGSGLFEDADFRAALRAITSTDTNDARRIISVSSRVGSSPEDAFKVAFAVTFETSTRTSLNPQLYFGPANVYATVTPIVLHRHLKHRGDARDREIEELIGAACTHSGLPTPVRVAAYQHSPFEGVPSVSVSRRSPQWLRWRAPDFLTSRQMVHALIDFASPVTGPVLVGSGRYMGLGLCRPLDGAAR